MLRRITAVPILLAIPLALLLAACETTPLEADAPLEAEMDLMADARAPVDGKTASQLAQVRRLTAPFHTFENGKAAGWDAPLSECVESPAGGMGFHYGNMEYVDDGGVVDALQPEVLLYEPRKNGKMRLVGVEYIVPVEVEQDEEGFFPRPDHDAPVLFDREFHWNPVLSLWALHVWIWRDNPSGMFADFNPKVTCAYAD